jgi:hypothetical protein
VCTERNCEISGIVRGVVEAVRLPVHHAAWVGSFGTNENRALPQKNESLSVTRLARLYCCCPLSLNSWVCARRTLKIRVFETWLSKLYTALSVLRVLAVGLQPAIIGVSGTAVCWNIMCRLYRLFLQLLFIPRREESQLYSSVMARYYVICTSGVIYSVLLFCKILPVVNIHNTVRTGTISVAVLVFCCVKKNKSKAVPLQAWSGPEGSRKIRFPDYM